MANTVSRRGLLLGAAAAGLLAGCGGQKPATSTAPSAGFPVSVTGKYGTATVTEPPKRVVTCGYLRDIDLALALGATLVGAVRNISFPSGLGPWQHAPSNVQLLDARGGTPFEKIAALRPDLILASDDYSLDKDYAQLSAIAPTLSCKNGIGKDSWQEMTERAAKLLGQSTVGNVLVSGVTNKIAATKSQHPELAGRTFAFGPVLGPQMFAAISSPTDASAQFFSQLGMTLSPKVAALPPGTPPGRSTVSQERLDVLDADVLILAYLNDKFRPAVEANPLFKQLDVVRRGAYIPLDLGTALAIGFPSVLSIPYGLDAVAPKLAAALKKS